MTQEEYQIFLEQVTPIGEQFSVNGVIYFATVKAKSTPETMPNMENEQDDT
jgi:hypothetical protein